MRKLLYTGNKELSPDSSQHPQKRTKIMKEQLYTIPLNDAVNAGDECPFCFIERSVEQDLLDFVLGSGSSYMESDVREATDKAGFCRVHFKKCLITATRSATAGF